MATLIYFLKALYAYCTDFVINLANLTGLSYYEINFILFILLYPLLLFLAVSMFLFQKNRLRKLKNQTTISQNHKIDHELKSLTKFQIYLFTNLAWFTLIVWETKRIYAESAKYYTEKLLNNEYPPEADSIIIPIMDETLFAFSLLCCILVFFNLFIFASTRKANLPAPLFNLPPTYSIDAILWEVFIGMGLFIDLIAITYLSWSGLYIQAIITLFLGYILLNIRAGQVNKNT
jgi:hypothetical protein